MSDPPRRSSRLGGMNNTVEKEDPLIEDPEALAQRAIDAARLAQLAIGQGTPGPPLTSTLNLSSSAYWGPAHVHDDQGRG